MSYAKKFIQHSKSENKDLKHEIGIQSGIITDRNREIGILKDIIAE